VHSTIARRGALRIAALALAPGFAGALVAVAVPAADAVGKAAAHITHTVVIDGTKFEPATLEVRRGDAVVWVNRDPFPHTATAAGAFDSGSIAANRSWRMTARTAGRFDYLCTFHPNMKATLVVR